MVQASQKRKARGYSVPQELNWLDQQGLNVLQASQEGTTEDVRLVHLQGIISVDGTGSPLQVHYFDAITCAREGSAIDSRSVYVFGFHICILCL